MSSRNTAGLFKRAANQQGGLLSGSDPTQFTEHDPIRLWIIQLAVIIVVAQVLGLVLRKIRQPRVIAEILGGILLGPTALGRIPGFTEHVFPDQSRSYLSLTANIGLCLFLFLVGLEIDIIVIKRNARLAISIALAGMAIPFGFGAALAVPIYNQFIDDSIKFTHFMLFTSVAFSITAFPVLCRILTELKLLDTTVGIVVLSAGVGNDIVGWVLLALSVALVNASSGLTALYILLTCVGWTLFLLVPVKWVMNKVAQRTGSIENGPTMFFLTVTFLVTFVSAWFTDVIGVHAIFGAFLAGIIIPREGGLAIALTERMEDMVSVVFLPLYFTLSGLSTDLGLLNDGITWGYTIAICILAFLGKFGGCTLAAKYAAGFNWRESSAIGSLMSCKGLVELIVLNVGLSAGILSRRVFSMFVLEALLLTFITTPLVTALYPLARRDHVAASGANFNNVPGEEHGKSRPHVEEGSPNLPSSYTVVLDKIEHLPGMMAITQLLRPEPMARRTSQLVRVTSNASTLSQPVFIDALRLMELTDRTSAVMKSSVTESLLLTDSILSVFRMFGRLNDLEVHSSLKVVPYAELASSVAEHAQHSGTDMVLIPWLPGLEHSTDDTRAPRTSNTNNPFGAKPSASVLHSHFVRGVFVHSTTHVAMFIDRTTVEHSAQQIGKFHHLLVPFFGGPDDRLALEFVVHLCERNPDLSATIMRCTKSEVEVEVPEVPEAAYIRETSRDEKATAHPGGTVFPDTIYGTTTSEARLVSDTADNVLWSRYQSIASKSDDKASTSSFGSRIEFCEISTPRPLSAINERARQLSMGHRVRALIVAGRSRRLAAENHDDELRTILGDHGEPVEPEVRKTIGDVATACMVLGSTCGMIVVQAAHNQGA